MHRSRKADAYNLTISAILFWLALALLWFGVTGL